ncbi:HIT family protein [Bartonella sp. HY329]|uniref:HIT family protein n=1 Tax=unclassified Bartonella TaxID=2645622 RepID=UPI0021C5FF02|nr:MULTISPECIES: HIT family protein [unclassified Bartonella]UXM93871.1 HIT family protein [Bartonella sp. HY329]UXN08192.1 HIT family protein [Bartonella sp. HY328]
MTTHYDNDNIFAKILRDEIPSIRVYEDENTIALMDVMPQGEGHVLIIPRKASRNILDAEPEALMKTILTVQKIANAVKKAFNSDGVTVMQFNETAGGQSVFHLHFHVIPRFDGIALKPHIGGMADANHLEEQAKKIRAVIEK